METSEKTYPGIGLLIVVGGSLLLWLIIFWFGHAMYMGLTR